MLAWNSELNKYAIEIQLFPDEIQDSPQESGPKLQINFHTKFSSSQLSARSQISRKSYINAYCVIECRKARNEKLSLKTHVGVVHRYQEHPQNQYFSHTSPFHNLNKSLALCPEINSSF